MKFQNSQQLGRIGKMDGGTQQQKEGGKVPLSCYSIETPSKATYAWPNVTVYNTLFILNKLTGVL